MVVIDASALVVALAGQSPSAELKSLIAYEQLHAPYLIDYEFLSALRGLELRKKLTPAEAEGARIVKQDLLTRATSRSRRSSAARW
jgi:predicted nucleic acid-binding protein